MFAIRVAIMLSDRPKLVQTHARAEAKRCGGYRSYMTIGSDAARTAVAEDTIIAREQA